MDKFVKPVEPKPVEKPTDGYVYTGEKNYEAPKPDAWVSDSGEKK